MSNKIVYKTNFRTPTLETLKILTRLLTVWFEDGYCNITIANRRLITVIRFVVKNYIHPWKNFANRLHLMLHAYEIFFSKNMRATMLARSKHGPDICNSYEIYDENDRKMSKSVYTYNRKRKPNGLDFSIFYQMNRYKFCKIWI